MYTYLKCSIYKNIIYIFGRPLPIYLYATYTWFIAYLYTTHCIVRLKTIYVYSPCKLPRVPKHSSYTSYELDINHLNSAHVGLLLLGPAPPRPQGEKEPFGWGWGCVWRSLFIYIYIYIHTHIDIFIHLHSQIHLALTKLRRSTSFGRWVARTFPFGSWGSPVWCWCWSVGADMTSAS